MHQETGRHILWKRRILLKNNNLIEMGFCYEEDVLLNHLEIEIPKLEEKFDI